MLIADDLVQRDSRHCEAVVSHEKRASKTVRVPSTRKLDCLLKAPRDAAKLL